MFDSVKKLLHVQPPHSDDRALAAWAKAHGHVFKTVRNERGGVVECHEGHRNWRIEWGQSQRVYVEGNELRIREELGVSPDFQLLLLSRTLAAKLESDVFQRFTEAMQTQIDHTMPEEMRWLAMFPKVSMGDNKPLKARFHLQSPNGHSAQGWITGPLGPALLQAAQTVLESDPPFVLMVLRGKLYLRMQAPHVTEDMLEAVNVLFGVAAAEARRAGALVADPSSSGGANSSGWSSTSGTAWSTQLPSELPPESSSTRSNGTAAHR